MKDLGLRRLFNNALATFGRQLSAGLLQLLTLAIIARTYGAEGSGAYTIALLLPTILASLLNMGIAPANVYYLATSKVTTLTAWNRILKLYTVIVLIGLTIGIIGLQIFAEKWFPGIPSLWLWLALTSFPVTLLLLFISSFFQGLQKFKQLNLTLLLQPLLTLVLVVLLIFTGIKSVGWILSAYLAGSIIALYFAFRTLRPYLLPSGEDELNDYGNAILNYGYKAHLSNILAFINYKSDIFLVNFFMGPASVGIYIISIQLSERLWLLSQSVSSVLLPKLSQLSGDEDLRGKLTPLITRWVLWVTLLAATFLAIIAIPLIYFIFGEDFLGAFIPLLILLPGTVLGAASRILANDIAARGRPELNMYTSFFVVLINIFGNILLIPEWGISGAAMATSVAYSINFLLRLVMYNRFTKIPIITNIIIGQKDFALLKKLINDKPRIQS